MLTLSEAESMRRFIQVTRTSGSSKVSGELGLILVPGIVFEATRGYNKKGTKSALENLKLNIQCLKFFNNEMFYQKEEAKMLLHAFSSNGKSERRDFFEALLKSKTKVSQFVDRHADSASLSFSDDESFNDLLTYDKIHENLTGKNIFDICSECDSDGNGFLSHNEFKSVFASTGVVINETDLDNLVTMMDMTWTMQSSIQNLLDYLVKTQHQVTEPLL